MNLTIFSKFCAVMVVLATVVGKRFYLNDGLANLNFNRSRLLLICDVYN